MLLPAALLAVAPVIRFASAQTVDPSSVEEGTRKQWCLAQSESCPLLCYQYGDSDPESNDCDSDTLDYKCECKNGVTPNATEYSQTIPYFLCTETNNKCVKDCTGNDSKCQSDCREKHPCGAKNPKRANKTSTATTSSGTATASGTSTATDTVYTGLGDGSGSKGGDEKGAAMSRMALEVGQVYGLTIMVGGFLAGFAVLL